MVNCKLLNCKLYSFHYYLHTCRLSSIVCLEHIYARYQIGRHMEGSIAHKALFIHVGTAKGKHAYLHHPLRSASKADIHTFTSLHDILLDGEAKLCSLFDGIDSRIIIFIEILVADSRIVVIPLVT